MTTKKPQLGWVSVPHGRNGELLTATAPGQKFEFCFAQRNGRWALVGVCIEHAEGIGVAEVRGVPIDLAWRVLRTSKRDASGRVGIGKLGPEFKRPERQRQERRPDVRRWTERKLAELAEEYVREMELGERKPVHAMWLRRQTSPADRVSREYLGARITEARKRGLLTATEDRRPGGRLTVKAKRLLKGDAL
ncbi:MAG TPA: hypothetical protein VK631_20915 [Solirubrobacteraceae bacterium]|nr:hypothetical protein [Solirubrobacteraceae bacterium]